MLQLTAIILPGNTTYSKALSWSSSNVYVANVSSDGLVTAVSPGTAVITVMTSKGITATCTVIVTAASTPTPVLPTLTPTPIVTQKPTPVPTQTPTVNVINIAVSQSTVYLKKGSSATLGVVPDTDNNSKVKLTWQSSDPNTVSVTQTGKVKALKAGSAMITAAVDNGKSVKIDVIVGGKAATSISVKNPPMDYTMTVGDRLKLDISVKPANAQGVITFVSTNVKVVSVDAAGRLKALKKGSASIVVEMGAKIVTLSLKVK